MATGAGHQFIGCVTMFPTAYLWSFVCVCVCSSLLALFYFFGISLNGHGVQRACVWADVPRLFSACVHRKREVRNGRVHNNAMLCAFKRIRTSTITINECCQASDDSYLFLCLSLSPSPVCSQLSISLVSFILWCVRLCLCIQLETIYSITRRPLRL